MVSTCYREFLHLSQVRAEAEPRFNTTAVASELFDLGTGTGTGRLQGVLIATRLNRQVSYTFADVCGMFPLYNGILLNVHKCSLVLRGAVGYTFKSHSDIRDNMHINTRNNGNNHQISNINVIMTMIR